MHTVISPSLFWEIQEHLISSLPELSMWWEICRNNLYNLLKPLCLNPRREADIYHFWCHVATFEMRLFLVISHVFSLSCFLDRFSLWLKKNSVVPWRYHYILERGKTLRFGSVSLFHHLPAARLKGSSFISPSLHSLICKMGLVMPHLASLWWDLNEIIYESACNCA